MNSGVTMILGSRDVEGWGMDDPGQNSEKGGISMKVELPSDLLVCTRLSLVVLS